MLLYDQVEPLNSDTHAQWRIAPQASWAFAAKAHAVPLLASEFAAAQADYTIAFATDEAGGVMPVVLFSLKAQHNRFVNDQGQWMQGAYVPAYVRRFPFALAGEGEKKVVVIETASGVVGPFEQGVALFEDGQPTDTLQRSLSLVEAFQREVQVTHEFCQLLKKLDVLTEVTAEVRDGENAPHRLSGMLVVDEKRLAQSDDETVLSLFKSGQLAWVYAHLMSLKNLPRYQLAA